MNAIQTKFAGYHFRSRSEARWAVFLRELGVSYEYEKEGFHFDDDMYLPDFWIPEWNAWVEIKPEKPKLTQKADDKVVAVMKREYGLCKKLAESTKKPVLLIGGSPWREEERIEDTSYSLWKSKYSISLFSHDYIIECPIPEFSIGGARLGIDIDAYFARSLESNFALTDKFYGFVCSIYNNDPSLFEDIGPPRRGDALQLIEADRRYYLKRHGREHPNWHYGITSSNLAFGYKNNRLILVHDEIGFSPTEGKLEDAYNVARQKRFEFEDREK